MRDNRCGWAGLLLGSVALGLAVFVWSAAARAAGPSGHSGHFVHGDRNKQFYFGPFPGKKPGYQTFHHFYRPNPGANQFKSHTAFFFPQNQGHAKGGYFYFKNKDRNSPNFNQFWGRCRAGSNNYELLAPEKRKANLEEIAEADFVPQGKMTPVPGMEPETPILPPPNLDEAGLPTGPPEE